MKPTHETRFGNPWPVPHGWFSDMYSRSNHYYNLQPQPGYAIRAIDWARRDVPRFAPDWAYLIVAPALDPAPINVRHGQILTSLCRRATRNPVRYLRPPSRFAPNCLRCTQRLAHTQ